MLQHGWNLKTLCQVKEASYKCPNILWVILSEMSRAGKYIGIESRSYSEQGSEESREWLWMGMGFLFGWWNVLELVLVVV